jgi:hypothetical protein
VVVPADREEQHLIMTETVPPGPFDDMEALAWLRSRPGGRVTASAAELSRQWGWNRMRASRRLKAREEAGLIRRNAEAIIVPTSVTPTVSDVTPIVTDAVSVTATPTVTVARRSMTPVKLVALMVALALALACAPRSDNDGGMACGSSMERYTFLRNATRTGI